MTKRRYSYFTSFTLIVLATVLLLAPAQPALAATGDCFFNSNEGPVTGTGQCSAAGRYGAYGTNDVFTGRNSSGGGMAIGPGINNKTDFRNFIKNRFAGSNTQNRVGAAYVVQRMLPSDDRTWPSNAQVTQWDDLMKQGTVTFQRTWDPTVGRTSYYDPGKHNVFISYHPTVGREVIYIRQQQPNGTNKLLAEIETACGNMLPFGATLTTPSWTLEGNSNANPNVAGRGQGVTFKHHVKNNGPDDMDAKLDSRVIWAPATTGPGVTPGNVIRNCDVADGLDDGERKDCDDSFTIPNAAQNNDVYCQKIEFKPRTRGDTAWRDSTRDCVTVSVMSCTALTLSISSPEPGENVTATFGANGTPIPGYRLVYTLTRPNGTTATNGPAGHTASRTMNLAINNVMVGTYNVAWRFVNGNGQTVNCSGTFSVSNKPYFRVYNGDLNAIAKLPAACTSGGPATGTIRAFNKGAAGSYAGSGAQVSAIAATAIAGFTSLAIDPTSTTNPKLRTFSNSAGEYGGNFNAAPTCIPDYWANIPSGAPATMNIGTTTISGPVAPVYVNGNVYITGTGIRYDQTPRPLASLPSYWIIATGNIYISSTVTQLDGVYVARGTIYTCTSTTGVHDVAFVSNNCTTQLTINGAFIADKVKLLRTTGTLRNSVANEGRTAAGPAERFTFSPDLWVGQPNTGGGGGSVETYDSVTTLPPVL